MNPPPLRLLTVTWSADLPHFRLLRRSLQRSALAALPHDVVVQSEDLEAFARLDEASPGQRGTGEVLPPEVETRRLRARRRSARWGRRLTRLSGSLAARTGGWPHWVRYTGWHTQQIAKLAAAAESDIDHVVVLDSDVVVLPSAAPADFLDAEGRIVCFERWAPADQVRGKVAKWNRQAPALFGRAFDPGAPRDVCFDTPFVLHAPTLRAMLRRIESRYERPWWQALLAQPPRHWSEFASYRYYLRHFVSPETVAWRPDDLLAYIFEAADSDAVEAQVAARIDDPVVRYVTIHSQSAGRGLWGAEQYGPRVAALLERHGKV